MSFWGLSDQGKQAQNNLSGIGNQYQQMMDYLMKQAQSSNDAGGFFRDNASQYWRNLVENGGPSIGQNRGAGQDIMPLEDLTKRLWQRQQGIDSAWGGIPNVNLGEHLSNIMNNINWNQGYVQDQIDKTHDSAAGREGDTSAAVRDLINSSYGGARGTLKDAYGGARKDNASTYSDIISKIGNAYGDMRTNAERIRPAGQMQQAEVARSFAPNIAATLGRLRKSGIDPNSVAASNVLGNVETGRARAMDDRAAASTADYVRTLNGIRSGELGDTTGAMTRRLANETALGTQQAGQDANLQLGQGQASSQEMLRNLSALTGIDFSRMGNTVTNLNTTMGLQNQTLQDRMKADMITRDMGRQDAQDQTNLYNQQNNLDLGVLGLQNQQWGMGTAQNQYNQGQQNLGAQGLMQLMQQMFQNANAQGQQAQGYGSGAANIWNQKYQQEAANAGWGKKLLGGIAGAAMNYFLPGSGSLFGGGGSSGGSGGLFGGNGKTPPFTYNVAGGTANPASAWYTGSSLYTNPFGNFQPIGGGKP